MTFLWSAPWLLLAACTPGPVDARSAPSVLLVTVDSLRADHVGAYGDAEALTPTLDRLAASGTTFLRAYTSTPQTIPGHATLMTGKYPPSHGVRDDGDFSLGDEQVTLAERFRAAGYTTIAIASSFTTRRRWGLDQGFQIYTEPGTPGRSGSHVDERAADEAVDDALRELAQAPLDKPVFLWVHLFDPHAPYDPPPQWTAMFPSSPYDGEVAFVDDELGRLLVSWEMRFGVESSIVAVTAPHGESLGEDDEETSGYLLHDATLRVPLIVRGPGMAPGQRVSDPVGLVDVAPTLLDLAHLSQHRGMQGDDLRDGGSDVIYSESLVGMYNMGLAPLYALTDERGRFVRGAYGSFYPAFGDRIVNSGLRMEPRGSEAIRLGKTRRWLGERHAPEVALDAQMLTMLGAIGYVGGNAKAVPGTLDPRDVSWLLSRTSEARRLIDIGMYQQADDLLDDLSDHLPPGTFGLKLMQAQLLCRLQGRLAEADQAFQNLFMANPSGTVAALLTSVAIARAGAGRRLVRHRLHWLDPTNPEVRAGLVRCAYVLGNYDLAMDRCTEMVALMPDDPQTVLVGAELGLRDLPPRLPCRWRRRSRSCRRRPGPTPCWAGCCGTSASPTSPSPSCRTPPRLDPYPAPIRIGAREQPARDGAPPRGAAGERAWRRGCCADHPAAQEVYRLARDSVTDDDWNRIRRDRARGPDGRPIPYARATAPVNDGPAEGPTPEGTGDAASEGEGSASP
ncbi:MAG: sulfatase-like hydrolase/transferase [Myxococcota bacterium]